MPWERSFQVLQSITVFKELRRSTDNGVDVRSRCMLVTERRKCAKRQRNLYQVP